MQSSKDSYWAKAASKFDKGVSEGITSLLGRIKDDIGCADRVLDIAAGTGIVSLELSKCVQQVDALDIESEMIAVARKKAEKARISNISFHIQSAYELNFPDNIFDATVILNSLHVMETPNLALLEAARVLKPKGLLIAPTYCHAETEESLDNYQRWSLKTGHKSHNLFTCDSLCRLIRSCGFKVQTKCTVAIDHGDKSAGVMIIGYIVASPDLEAV